jgi:hypothetical protein
MSVFLISCVSKNIVLFICEKNSTMEEISNEKCECQQRLTFMWGGRNEKRRKIDTVAFHVNCCVMCSRMFFRLMPSTLHCYSVA